MTAVGEVELFSIIQVAMAGVGGAAGDWAAYSLARPMLGAGDESGEVG